MDREKVKSQLSPVEYEVMCNEATEPPFQNEYWNFKGVGIYVDKITGDPLFASTDKFDSGSGWPSFVRALGSGSIIETIDHSHGMKRVEVKSKYSNGHLGHLFDDGPKELGGLRYCINSASLRFVGVENLVQEGLQNYLSLFKNELKGINWALMGGGCFWGVEELLIKVPGILDVEVGYAGGESKHPTYEQVKKGETGHAEVVLIKYDTKTISYAEILDHFYKLHDPTTKNRQEGDVGTQYRSVIFFNGQNEETEASQAIDRAHKSGRWKNPIVTEVVRWERYWRAEDYHQDYLQKNPKGYMCHYWRS
ncbi:MAG: bifunctional methionine sulfoxide reductase B/A protein [Bacteriovoracaceae bacterium]|nr:bifunctional methionine sulfoxide reductase B/A protein [Bacteriovoracaceae bacterium]